MEECYERARNLNRVTRNIDSLCTRFVANKRDIASANSRVNQSETDLTTFDALMRDIHEHIGHESNERNDEYFRRRLLQQARLFHNDYPRRQFTANRPIREVLNESVEHSEAMRSYLYQTYLQEKLRMEELQRRFDDNKTAINQKVAEGSEIVRGIEDLYRGSAYHMLKLVKKET